MLSRLDPLFPFPRALHQAEWNLSRAASLLGITRPTLYSLLDKYDMRPARSGEAATDQSDT